MSICDFCPLHAEEHLSDQMCHGRGGGSQASDDDGMECECDWCGVWTNNCICVKCDSSPVCLTDHVRQEQAAAHTYSPTDGFTCQPSPTQTVLLSVCLPGAATARHMLAHAQTARRAVREARGREKSDTRSGKWSSLLT